jgi:(p)ppGpp synthase/HD superfamily hydrolase
MKNIINRAIQFAKNKHENQKRKYTGEPYFVHCQEVADIVRSVSNNAFFIISLLSPSKFAPNSIHCLRGMEK